VLLLSQKKLIASNFRDYIKEGHKAQYKYIGYQKTSYQGIMANQPCYFYILNFLRNHELWISPHKGESKHAYQTIVSFIE